MRALSLAVLVFSCASVAQAGDHPCKRVEAACIAAGYVKGAARAGHGLGKNCVQPLLAGASVPGVSIDLPTVQACVARKAAKHRPPPPPPAPPFPPPKE